MQIKIIFSVTIMLATISTTSLAQINNTDSLRQLLQQKIHDTVRVNTLAELGFQLCEVSPDLAMDVALEGLALSRKTDYVMGEALCLTRVGNVYLILGNFPKSMSYQTEALRINEKIRNEDGLQKNYNNIGLIYMEQDDSQEALQWFFKAKEISTRRNTLKALTINLINIGEVYLKLGNIDSARFYTQASYDLAKKISYLRMIGSSQFVLGEVHFAEHEHNLALEYYKISTVTCRKAENYSRVVDGLFGMAKVFQIFNQPDSFLYYSRQSMVISKEKGFIKQLLTASNFLFAYYVKMKSADSAFYYLGVSKAANDTMYSQQKLRELQTMAFEEKVRQQELKSRELEALAVRDSNLQNAGIAIAVVAFIIFFLLLSHSVVANEKLIRFLGILTLLIVFEFINLLLHPYLANITGHSSVLMLIILVGIAALLIPLHHKLEKWISYQLVQKNKQIRLIAAKKTIAQLEQSSDTI